MNEWSVEHHKCSKHSLLSYLLFRDQYSTVTTHIFLCLFLTSLVFQVNFMQTTFTLFWNSEMICDPDSISVHISSIFTFSNIFHFTVNLLIWVKHDFCLLFPTIQLLPPIRGWLLWEQNLVLPLCACQCHIDVWTVIVSHRNGIIPHRESDEGSVTRGLELLSICAKSLVAQVVLVL